MPCAVGCPAVRLPVAWVFVFLPSFSWACGRSPADYPSSGRCQGSYAMAESSTRRPTRIRTLLFAAAGVLLAGCATTRSTIMWRRRRPLRPRRRRPPRRMSRSPVARHEKAREFGPAAASAVCSRSRGLTLGLGDAAPVAVAVNGEDLRVVDEAVDERGGGGGVGEDGRPFTEGQVGGEDETVLE
jgi:hypothetical protein